jgi:uncharacterized protein YndB with AHSA1/START domain
MLRKLLIAIVLVVAVFAGYVAMQPDVYALSRSAVIAAPPDAVFGYLEDFRKWELWSPWAKRDPNAKATFSGEPKGRGAVFEWSGNSEVGAGRMTMMQSRAPGGLTVKLDFTKPYESTSNVTFLLKPEAGGTRVTWSMSGRQTFLEKAFCLMMGGMDRLVGPDYEKGLANLKAVAEAKKS